MNEIELFEFDRQGYIVIEGLLQADVVAALSRAVDDLEEHAVLRVQDPPRKPSGWGGDYHANPERGYHVNGERAMGKTIMIEDFWNADPAFDVIVAGRSLSSAERFCEGKSCRPLLLDTAAVLTSLRDNGCVVCTTTFLFLCSIDQGCASVRIPRNPDNLVGRSLLYDKVPPVQARRCLIDFVALWATLFVIVAGI